MCKISPKSVQGFLFCACGISRSLALSGSSFFFWGGGVLEKDYRRDARTDLDAKYVKRRGSAQENAFGGSRFQYLRFSPSLFPHVTVYIFNRLGFFRVLQRELKMSLL